MENTPAYRRRFFLTVLCVVSQLASAVVFTSCGPAGELRCDSTFTAFFVPPGTNYVLENCVLYNCPPFVFSGTNTTGLISNVHFRDSGLAKGYGAGTAVQILAGAKVTINNAKFSNLTADNGGAVYIDASTVTLNNIMFNSNSAVAPNSLGGGDLLIQHTATVTCNNCSSYNCGSCVNNNAVWGACWVIDMNSKMFLKDAEVVNAHAVAGSVVFLNHMSSFTGTSLRIKDSYADGQGGCFYSYGNCATTCYNCTFNHCYSPRGFGGLAVVQSFSSMYLYGTLVLDAQAVNSMAGAILGTGSAVVVLDQGTVIRNAIAPLGAALKNEGQSTISVLGGSQIINCTASINGAAYYGASGGTFIVNNAIISDNTARGDGGAIIAVGGENVFISNNSQLLNNKATRYGGAFFGSGEGTTFKIQGPVQLSGNKAGTAGGAFYYDSLATVELSGNDVQMKDNSAQTGDLAAVYTILGGDITRPKDFDGSKLFGTIYIEFTEVSLHFLAAGTFSGMSNVKLRGRASSLNIANVTSFNNMTINFASKIPTFSVYAVDVFGNSVPANMWNPVIVLVSEVAHNATIEGENLKAILDEKTNSVWFTGLRIPEAGEFKIQVSGFYTSLDLAPNAVWPSFGMTVVTCDADTQMNTAQSYRSGIAGAAIVATLFVALNMAGLMKYRTLKLMRSNSIRFLVLACAGCVLCLASLIVQISTFQLSCKVAAVLDNIGFALIFGALCVKSVRIQVLFDNKRSQKSKLNIAVFVSDNVLTGYVIIGCTLMILFLVAWFMVTSPDPIVMITGEQAVTQRCNLTSTFGILITVIRIVVIFFAAFMAFQIRNVPSVYNESKFLGFATYNWFLFTAVAILVPTIMTVALLVSVKLWICVFNPDAARMIDTLDTDKDSKDIAVTPDGSLNVKTVQTAHKTSG
ncbi:7 transmembrane sweet-taste receptor of 3 GCPR-domain-containing protein [Obelidium mucronatum]|nr:7 transmembrane sweet-taste receptor of 3 GCPR-domain-containing protein [Obelidium mucronatum]